MLASIVLNNKPQTKAEGIDKKMTLEKLDERDYGLKEYLKEHTNSRFSLGLHKILLVEPCPICGGHDCFNILPDNERWYCHEDEYGGYLLDFIRKYYDVSLVQADKLLFKHLFANSNNG